MSILPSGNILDALTYPEMPNPACGISATFQHIGDAIKHAVSKGDQPEAKRLWKCKTIALVQRDFIAAFDKLKQGHFYEAWCLFERCELDSANLFKHYTAGGGDPHRTNFIRVMTERWQKLFPYKIFLSPELLKKETLCSICQSPIKPHTSCSHIVGEIYDGEICNHIITKSEVLGISLVDNPVQKYSVVFAKSADPDAPRDNYDYTLVQFVIDRVESPFHEWLSLKTTQTITADRFSHLQPADPCPCMAGKNFGECCLGKSKIVIPHVQIDFKVRPNGKLPTMIPPF